MTPSWYALDLFDSRCKMLSVLYEFLCTNVLQLNMNENRDKETCSNLWLCVGSFCAVNYNWGTYIWMRRGEYQWPCREIKREWVRAGQRVCCGCERMTQGVCGSCAVSRAGTLKACLARSHLRKRERGREWEISCLLESCLWSRHI